MFVNQSNDLTEGHKHRTMRSDNEDGTELQPMVRREYGLWTCLPAAVCLYVLRRKDVDCCVFWCFTATNISLHCFQSSGTPLLVQNGRMKYLHSSFFLLSSVPSRGWEKSDNCKVMGEQSSLDSPSHACCRKVRTAAGCLILWTLSRTVKLELRCLPFLLPPPPPWHILYSN